MSISDLRTAVQKIEAELPDNEFGIDLVPLKNAITLAYNVANDHEKRIVALEAAVSKVP
jgi:hypothetical protein